MLNGVKHPYGEKTDKTLVKPKVLAVNFTGILRAVFDRTLRMTIEGLV
jgi:hypothetical protein